MKNKMIITGIVVSIISLFLILHTTPTLALRTSLFLNGYFYEAMATEVIDDKFHNKVDKDILEKQNAKCYTLTIPPVEKVTQTELRNFKVTKDGSFYSVEYYGEG
ncbi:hypothetical protein CHF27_009655 [Romboutsia maritimum]|uniref:Uncharacterized protein n=1 Tax=Romboutsia maritimum TaxID=2020948 RepID=A0A371IRV8_9FIRM|nr:hypothetical protein [Romboutsia maritimum]RDY23203.1 hypothetical protein CHF27_009655 [Romboutsia maritimum]